MPVATRQHVVLIVREGESLPPASSDFFLVRAIVQVSATADVEYVCLRDAGGSYVWVSTTPDLSAVSGPASSVDGEVALFSGTGGTTIKRATGTGIARLAAGVLSAVTPAAIQVDVAYRTSGSASITSTTGTNLGSLTASVTLASGYVWDLIAWGSINSNAPAGGFIFGGCRIDGTDNFGWTDTGTVGGERTLGFGGYKLGVAGDGAAHTANARMKVDTGTGTVNTGWIVLVAIPRLP